MAFDKSRKSITGLSVAVVLLVAALAYSFGKPEWSLWISSNIGLVDDGVAFFVDEDAEGNTTVVVSDTAVVSGTVAAE
ncbi:hypothetical protein [Jiella pelagia]|uniref:Uncharacterized protein n=1 Tax=Jiella pelagia TaxID=2986949 RepID=A0ABY7C2N7_9HYPH|nr:hypothetical protein [Jiella pelagia]WAP69028.1 hypothetical protein OH818_01440 [Jiella pelagia]